ncbi:hypothetical protein BJV82DRAFT_602331 [Fennellomyces sp. T-0311]|nr:hypothetical protein BJV82DRAFT_602331 [Fennellomyces sp. T-0311]
MIHTTLLPLILLSFVPFFSSQTRIAYAKEHVPCPVPGGKTYAAMTLSYCVDYYTCDAQGNPIVLSCPGGWMFDNKSQKCAPSHDVSCK